MQVFATHTTTVLLIVVGVIHLLPVSGLLSIDRLNVLYGIKIDDPNLVILMRHRAVLFGLLGLFLIYSAFRPTLQMLALIAGFVSAASFLWIAYASGSFNDQISRVMAADIFALACLIIATISYWYSRTGQ